MDIGLYKLILNAVTDSVYIVDNNRVITFWNDAAEKITGFSFKELVGRECADNILCHVDDGGKELCKDGCPLHKQLLIGNRDKPWSISYTRKVIGYQSM